MQPEHGVYDIFIVGGGINGCGIARDAAGRGYSVYLAEKDDLASGTSSASTKLVHGGLRYLEHYEFRLVRKALEEREVLWQLAPHIIKPLRFVLPHHSGLRPAWLLRLGLIVYDHLGGRKRLPTTKSIDLRHHEAGVPLKKSFTRAFEYSDCWVDDARLVVLNAMDARERGAVIHTRSHVFKAEQVNGAWTVHVEDGETRERSQVRAKILINATGPWIDQFLKTSVDEPEQHNVRLVLGSHIVVKKLFDHDRCYIFQNDDGRILFAIPYEDDFTMIGTTDLDYEGDPDNPSISEAEVDYLCEAVSAYLHQPVTRDQIVWHFSGVRPLFDDGASAAQEATRDYVLRLDHQQGECGLLNVFGGKITTYRRLSEAVLKRVADVLGTGVLGNRGAPWTQDASLPGGDFPAGTVPDLAVRLNETYPFLSRTHATRLSRTYGTRAFGLLRDATDTGDLGIHFGADLYSVEVDYLIEQEFAQCSEDILFRRTKLGLRLSVSQAQIVDAYVREQT